MLSIFIIPERGSCNCTIRYFSCCHSKWAIKCWRKLLEDLNNIQIRTTRQLSIFVLSSSFHTLSPVQTLKDWTFSSDWPLFKPLTDANTDKNNNEQQATMNNKLLIKRPSAWMCVNYCVFYLHHIHRIELLRTRDQTKFLDQCEHTGQRWCFWTSVLWLFHYLSYLQTKSQQIH